MLRKDGQVDPLLREISAIVYGQWLRPGKARAEWPLQ